MNDRAQRRSTTVVQIFYDKGIIGIAYFGLSFYKSLRQSQPTQSIRIGRIICQISMQLVKTRGALYQSVNQEIGFRGNVSEALFRENLTQSNLLGINVWTHDLNRFLLFVLTSREQCYCFSNLPHGYRSNLPNPRLTLPRCS